MKPNLLRKLFLLFLIFAVFDVHADLFIKRKNNEEKLFFYVGGSKIEFVKIGETKAWDIVKPIDDSIKMIGLVQNGLIRVTVNQGDNDLRILTFKGNKMMPEGRLVDEGDDGTIEIANTSSKECVEH